MNIITDKQRQDAENNKLFVSESPRCSSTQRYHQHNGHNYYDKNRIIEESRLDSWQKTKIYLFLHSAQFERGGPSRGKAAEA
jgi:hypothetical protein